jgi:phage baseplate assembly protein W
MSFDLALIDSDIKIKADGTIRTVEDTNKLRQDVIKIILTPLGSVKFHQWYGSNINEGTIGQVPADNMLFEDISASISDSLRKLQTLQRAQATGQNVTLSELIAAIEDINVQRSINDLRQVQVIVSVLTRGLTKIDEVFAIRA